ncbi:MAG: NAD(P)H-dependent glycerol-3-phosphate dehydrogenase [Muribaculaceae bacterium]|nr:NAD(P)H-dependent glycerol-3-phosphate dehydrogenase [Muribaculaceae bacterium]
MTTKNFPGRVAVMGGGSWATALAKLLLKSLGSSILWYMRREDRIEDFKRLGHNPAYLTDVPFDMDRIEFSADINEVAEKADTLLMVMPSPYFTSHIEKLNVDISGKHIISAVKGIVPDGNMLITDYMKLHFGIPDDHLLVVSGPCHAEEVALERPSYLTIGCLDIEAASLFGQRLCSAKNCHFIPTTDVNGVEYAGVMKNIYAIGGGIVHGMKKGDNFMAMLVSNAIREMEEFLSAVCPRKRNICDSVYLGDLLVTAYSRFSRNHNFGSMIGKGYSVKAAKMEMEQTAEGYYGAKCIHEINLNYNVHMPIAEAVYDILYRRVRPETAISRIANELT